MKERIYDFTSALVDDVKGMKIGIPKDYLEKDWIPEVKEAFLAGSESTWKKKEPL